MPQGNLPEKARKVYLEAEASAKKTCPEGDDACIASKSWAAVKKGWKKEGDTWVPKSTAEFSLYISKASFDKATQERKWYAVTSDISPDSYNDEMSLSLYEDFLARIESNELPPERHRSEYWSGGIPYLSVSHYLDLNGEGVPGPTDTVYIDGDKLKAKGRFFDNELGRACFEAVCKDLYGEEKSDNKVRISIAFVDWGHKHKSNGYEFTRSDLNDICPECLKEIIMGESEGKIFLKGHLIHFALTRSPVNTRTEMEVRSMTTQKEDAASIVGEELSEQLEKAAKDVGKADLVIKSDQDEPQEEVELAKMTDEDEKDEKKKDKPEEEEEDEKEEKKSHALDTAWKAFLDAYNTTVLSEFSYREKVQGIQGAFDALGDAVKSSFSPTPKERQDDALEQVIEMLGTINARLEAQEQKFAIFEQRSLTSDPKTIIPEQPVRRSLQYAKQPDTAPVKPGSIRDIVNKSLGLQ